MSQDTPTPTNAPRSITEPQLGEPPHSTRFLSARIEELEAKLAAANVKLARLRELARAVLDWPKNQLGYTEAFEALSAELGEE